MRYLITNSWVLLVLTLHCIKVKRINHSKNYQIVNLSKRLRGKIMSHRREEQTSFIQADFAVEVL